MPGAGHQRNMIPASTSSSSLITNVQRQQVHHHHHQQQVHQFHQQLTVGPTTYYRTQQQPAITSTPMSMAAGSASSPFVSSTSADVERRSTMTSSSTMASLVVRTSAAHSSNNVDQQLSSSNNNPASTMFDHVGPFASTSMMRTSGSSASDAAPYCPLLAHSVETSPFHMVIPRSKDPEQQQLGTMKPGSKPHPDGLFQAGQCDHVLPEISTQILLVCLRRIRTNELLTSLAASDMQTLMEDAWHGVELFLLNAACWPLVDMALLLRQHHGGAVTSSSAAILSAIARCQALRLDPVELMLLEAILASNRDLAGGQPVNGGRKQLEIIQDRAQTTLAQYEVQTNADSRNLACQYPNKFGRILLVLPVLMAIPAWSVEQIFFTNARRLISGV